MTTGDSPPKPPDPMPLLLAARGAVDRQLKLVFEAPDRVEVHRHAAILAAWSARESAASTLVAQDLMSTSIATATVAVCNTADRLNATAEKLNASVVDFTERADRGTGRLVWATWALALAALVAAVIGAYVTLTVAPQVITVSPPPSLPVVVTPAPIAPPAGPVPRR